MSMATIEADLLLRTTDDLVLATTTAADEPVTVGEAVTVINLRDGIRHLGHVEQIDTRAGHVLLRIEDEPSRLERFRGQSAFLTLLADAQRASRAAYDTGDREQSNTCIRDHLSVQDAIELRHAHRYTCPQCGHLLKDRG